MLFLSILLTLSITLLVIGTIILYRKKHKDGNSFLSRAIDWKGKHRGLKLFLMISIIIGFEITVVNMSTRIAYLPLNQQINGSARWVYTNNQKYLEVEAEDRYSLGYLEGQYLSTYIVNYRSALTISGLYYGKNYVEMIVEAQSYLEFIPDHFIQEMQGIADGASQGSGWIVTFEDILLQNVFLDLAYGRWIPEIGPEASGIMGCTDIGVKNLDGSIVMGQNFDFPKILDYDSLFPSIVFVHTKLEGFPEIFGMRMGGMLSLPIAKNSNNITVVVTVIETNVQSDYSEPAIILLRQGLEEATNFSFLNKLFTDYDITVGFSLLVSNGTDIRGVQALPGHYRFNTNSTIVHTNRFLYDDYNYMYFQDGEFSLTRQQYVERLVDEALTDSTFTHSELLSVLGTQEDGIEGAYSAPCYDNGILGDATLAFFCGTHFAVGNVHDGLGLVPNFN